jgi:hypothetical protein
MNLKTKIKNYCKVKNITEFESGTDEWVDFITHLNPKYSLSYVNELDVDDELDFNEIENILEELNIEII